MPMILTLDLGTTYFKAALFDHGGNLVTLHREHPPTTLTQQGWWELDPDDFCETVRRTIHQLGRSASAGLSDVAAISFATQTNSFLLLDPANTPLTPIILWPDARAMDMEADLRRLAELPGFQETTGLPHLGGHFMAPKLRWLHRHDPTLWSRAGRLCLISDYLTLWFTGQHVTEAGAAGLTGAVDIHRLQWWPDVCRSLNLPDAWLPKVMRAGTDVGPILPATARELGLPPTCRFVLGCLDQYAGAIGAGNITPNGVSETTGTVLATVRCAAVFADADTLADNVSTEVFQGPGPDPGTWWQMAFGGTSANLLEWYHNQLPDRPGFEVLDRLAAQVPPGAEGVRVRPHAQAAEWAVAFSNWEPRHTRGHAARAIMEAVAFALADQVGSLCGRQWPAQVRSAGGAARSRLWLQIKADVLNVPFVATACPEPTSLGAAMLAARALGWNDLAGLARAWVHTQPPCHPDPQTHRIYRQLDPG